jgi:hypothetical protein
MVTTLLPELGTKYVEALKSVEALHNGSTLIFPSKKPTLKGPKHEIFGFGFFT